VNLAYRWLCRLSLEDAGPDQSVWSDTYVRMPRQRPRAHNCKVRELIRAVSSPTRPSGTLRHGIFLTDFADGRTGILGPFDSEIAQRNDANE
jgi:uncharacterized protein YcaQ